MAAMIRPQFGSPPFQAVLTRGDRAMARAATRASCRVDISFDEVQAVQAGQAAPGASLKDLERVYARKEFSVKVDLHGGKSEYTVYTCDLSKGYVDINAEYMT